MPELVEGSSEWYLMAAFSDGKISFLVPHKEISC